MDWEQLIRYFQGSQGKPVLPGQGYVPPTLPPELLANPTPPPPSPAVLPPDNRVMTQPPMQPPGSLGPQGAPPGQVGPRTPGQYPQEVPPGSTFDNLQRWWEQLPRATMPTSIPTSLPQTTTPEEYTPQAVATGQPAPQPTRVPSADRNRSNPATMNAPGPAPTPVGDSIGPAWDYIKDKWRNFAYDAQQAGPGRDSPPQGEPTDSGSIPWMTSRPPQAPQDEPATVPPSSGLPGSVIAGAGQQTQTPSNASRQGGYGPSWQPAAPAGPRPAGAGRPGGTATPGGAPPRAGGESPPAGAPPGQSPPTGGTGPSNGGGRGSERNVNLWQLLGVISMGLMRPMQPGQNWLGHVGDALGHGLAFQLMSEAGHREQAMDTRKLDVAERRADADIALARGRLDVATARLPSQIRRDEAAAGASSASAHRSMVEAGTLPELRRSQIERNRAQGKQATSTAFNNAFKAAVTAAKNPMDPSGAINWQVVQRQLQAQGYDLPQGMAPAPEAARIIAQRKLAEAGKDPQKQAAVRAELNRAAQARGWYPEW